VQVANTSARYLLTLGGGCRVPKQHAILNIALHLPNIGWMRFGDVDHVESDAIFVLLVELVERGNLPAKWRSSVAAEDQHHGLRAAEGRHSHIARTIEQGKREIRREIADSDMPGASAFPHGLERE
jgi:hypothetical protein